MQSPRTSPTAARILFVAVSTGTPTSPAIALHLVGRVAVSYMQQNVCVHSTTANMLC